MDELPLFRVTVPRGAGVQPAFRDAFATYTALVMGPAGSGTGAADRRSRILPTVENVLLMWVCNAAMEHAREGAAETEEFHAEFVSPRFRLSACALLHAV